jgi:hypothetical protein
MIFSKSIVLKTSFNFLSLAASAMLLASCVKPQNHQSKVDGAASFFVEKIGDPAVDTDSTVPGYSIPTAKLYTFTACVKDRRTEESLPSARFKIEGGAKTEEVTANKDGCLVWSEKIPFDFLANERYLPQTRIVTALGAQSGSRSLKLAVNPWKLNDKSEKFKDLDHTSVPASQLATDEQAALALKPESAGSQPRFLDLSGLPISNSPGQAADNQPVRVLKLEIKPRISLTDILGNSVPVDISVADGKLEVSAALIESLTSGGRESKSVVSQTSKPVLVKTEGGRVFAEITLPISRGSDASRFLLALKVSPVAGPKGLLPFEGLFSVGDMHSITESGSQSGELKASNADGNFQYSSLVKEDATSSTGERLSGTSSSTGSSSPTLPSKTNGSKRTNLFEMSTLATTWSGPVKSDVANRRTVKYSVRACFNDLSNGGRPAVNEVFSVRTSTGEIVKRTASDRPNQKGCIDWEDTIKHSYYAPEKYFKVTAKIKHASGFEVEQDYYIAPWSAWGFPVDATAKPTFIEDINGRDNPARARLLADAVEFQTGLNTPDAYRYEIDNFLSMQLIKRVAVRIPMRVSRLSSIRDGSNQAPEAIRPGKYLLKAAFVALVRDTSSSTPKMLVSPMLGLTRVVEVRAGGEIKTELDFPINDIRLLNARSFLAFEVKILNEEKLPANDPFLMNTKVNPESFIDQEAGAIMPTYVASVSAKAEKDYGVPYPVDDFSRSLPMTDAINSIGKGGSIRDGNSGLVKPFANVTVQKLFDLAKKDREEYRARMQTETSVGLFARRADAEFVSIYNEPAIVGRDQLLKTNNRILPNGGKGINALLTILNQPLQNFGSGKAESVWKGARPQINQKTLVEFLNGDKPFDARLATQFCGYFFYHTPRTKLSGVKIGAIEWNRGAWMDECISQVLYKGPDSVFMRDRRIRAIEVNPIAKKIRGRSMGFHTGADFSVSKGNSKSWGYGAGWGSSGFSGAIAQLSIASKMKRVFKFFASAPGVSGVGVDISARRDHSTSLSTSTGFGSQTALTMEQNELLISLKRAEQCVVIRPRPEFVDGIRMFGMRKAIGSQAADEVMSRGILICAGFARPQEVAERYYTFGYDQSGSNNLDPHAVENLPWLLSLRGQRDYATFLLTASASSQSLNEAGRTQIDIGDMPLERLEEAYKKYFAGKIASIPGFITTEPKIMRARNGSD